MTRDRFQTWRMGVLHFVCVCGTTDSMPCCHAATHCNHRAYLIAYRVAKTIGCLIFIVYFQQKSPTICGSSAKNELLLAASFESSPFCICALLWGMTRLLVNHWLIYQCMHFTQKSRLICGFFAKNDLQLKVPTSDVLQHTATHCNTRATGHDSGISVSLTQLSMKHWMSNWSMSHVSQRSTDSREGICYETWLVYQCIIDPCIDESVNE